MNKNVAEALNMLEQKYYKIIRVKYGTFACEDIKLLANESEHVNDIREWAAQFTAAGNVYPDDIPALISTVDNLFSPNAQLYYRRKVQN